MNKILLVYEDYADLMAVEGSLKKVGFDVIGLSSEYAVAEQILAFNPDLVVGSGKGGKVSSMGVGKRLKEMTRWQGKSVLIFPTSYKPNPQELIKIRVDMVLEAPVAPLRLVQVVGRILGHDEAVLLERLNKAMHVESSQKSISMSSGGPHSPEGESIYVKGSVEGTAGMSSEDASLGVERVDEFSEEVAINAEEQDQKFSFRFGDRMSSTEPSKVQETSEQSAFPDVDLKAFEREILGGGAPEVEKVEALDELSTVLDDEAQIAVRAQASLEKAQEALKDKMARYEKMVEDVKVSPNSTVTRVEARRRQREMEADWDLENVNNIDKLRQEFTKALFKK